MEFRIPHSEFRTEKMPTYEYQCKSCQEIHEAFQAITARPLAKCPSCGGQLKRLIGSGSGFIFRGSGFYITDYRSKGYQEAKKRDEQPKDPTPSTTTPSSSDK